MSKYIKVDKLITEIERREIILDKYKDSFEEAACCKQSEQTGGYTGQVCHGIIAWRPIPKYKEKQ